MLDVKSGFFKMNKKAIELLGETSIYIIFTLAFLAILILFITLQSSPKMLLQQKTAKQVALLIDASRAGTEIKIDIEEFLDNVEKGFNKKPIRVDNDLNIVTAQLSDNDFYKYSYFNDLNIDLEISGDYLYLKINE